MPTSSCVIFYALLKLSSLGCTGLRARILYKLVFFYSTEKDLYVRFLSFKGVSWIKQNQKRKFCKKIIKYKLNTQQNSLRKQGHCHEWMSHSLHMWKGEANKGIAYQKGKYYNLRNKKFKGKVHQLLRTKQKDMHSITYD